MTKVEYERKYALYLGGNLALIWTSELMTHDREKSIASN